MNYFSFSLERNYLKMFQSIQKVFIEYCQSLIFMLSWKGGEGKVYNYCQASGPGQNFEFDFVFSDTATKMISQEDEFFSGAIAQAMMPSLRINKDCAV